MKNLLGLALAGMMLAPLAAHADDLAAPTSVYNWTGFYIGVNAGYGWGHGDGSFQGTVLGVHASGPIPGFSPGGAVGGIQGGYNAQWESMVLGIEGDILAAGISGSSEIFNAFGEVATLKSTTQWISTLRGRVGYAAGPALFYGTGGLAVAGNRVQANTTGPFTANASDTETHVGWTLGLGVEYALNTRWTTGVEWKYMDLGKKTYSDLSSINGTADLNLKLQTFTFKANYRY